MKKNRGFTAVELIVAVCIFSMMAFAVYSVLSVGLNAYKRIKGFAGSQNDALLAFEKIERDIGNTFTINGMEFTGSASSFSFPDTAGAAGPVVKTTYYFDDEAGNLIRKEQAYAAAVKKSEDEGTTSVELSPLKELKFEYCRYDEEKEACEWKDKWSGAEPPIAVRFEAAFDSGGKTVKVKRIVLIPVSL